MSLAQRLQRSPFATRPELWLARLGYLVFFGLFGVQLLLSRSYEKQRDAITARLHAAETEWVAAPPTDVVAMNRKAAEMTAITAQYVAALRRSPWLLRLGVIRVAAIVAILWLHLRAHRRAKRTRLRAEQGLCTACGYDLRASPGQCPECGNETAS